MSGVRILHFLRDWWKFIQIPPNYTMALIFITTNMKQMQLTLFVPCYIGVNVPLSFWEPRFDSHHHLVLLSLSKTLYLHCCSRPRHTKGNPVGCERYCGRVCMCVPVNWRLARMLPREWRNCTVEAEFIPNPVTWVIVHCEVLRS